MENKENETASEEIAEQEVTETNSEDLFEFQGRQFDLSTQEGKIGLKAYMDAFSAVTGKVSNELGSLRKEVAPLRKFKTKVDTPDKAGVINKVSKLYEDGNYEEAINEMFGYVDNREAELNQSKAEDNFWKDYKSSRAEMFNDLDEDLAKSYVFSNYRDALYDAEDPGALIDAVLQPKVKKSPVSKPAAPVASEEPLATVGQSKVSTSKGKTDSKEKDEKDVSMEDVYKQFNFN